MGMTDPKEVQREYNRAYYRKRRDELNARSKAYYHANRDELLRKRAERHKNNPEPARARAAAHNAKNREWFKSLKSGLLCIKCGESHPATLDFHHRDPAEKTYNVGSMARGSMSKAKILAEIEKCDVLCANCHRKLHADEGDK